MNRHLLTCEKGLSLQELIFALSMAVVISAVVMPSYFGYQKSTFKHLHVMNTQQMLSIVESGILEEWVVKPNVGKTVSVSFSKIASNNAYISFIDPSGIDRAPYSFNSTVQVYNNSGTLEFYIKLLKDDGNHAYIDTTAAQDLRGSKQVHLLKRSDIDLLKE